MRFSNVFLGLAFGGLAVASTVVGCGGDDTGTGGTGGGTSSSTGTAGGFPCSPQASCTAGHECLSLVDNAAEAKPGLRMSQLTITKPSALASGIVKNVVAGGVAPALMACNVNGQATFNWLLQFDKAANKIKTGGAKPVTDATKGYSFVDEMVTQGGKTFHLQPVEVDATLGADGTFDAATGTDLLVPIYLDAGATQVVLLPLHKARLFGGKLSTDGNCIGKYNAEGLKTDNNCLGDDTNPTFITGAKLDGYITLEDADTVEISSLNETLCVLLSGDPGTFGDGGSPNKCKRTAGVIDFKGDWCDATNAAAGGGCADATSLGGDFAASAIKINN